MTDQSAQDRPDRACLLHRAPRGGAAWVLADPRYRTCGACLTDLRGTLREIGERWVELSPFPTRSGGTGPGAPGFGSRSPASDTVIVMQDWRSSQDAHVWVGSDGKVHREPERPTMSVPGELYTLMVHTAQARDMDGTRPIVGDMLRWLDGQLDWVTRQEGVVPFAAVLRTMVAQLRPVTGEERARRLGACPRVLGSGVDTRTCGTTLYATLSASTVRCSACEGEWAREEWPTLGRMIRTVVVA